MKKKYLFLSGVFLGVVITVVGVYVLMPKLMIVTHESKYGFEETVSKVESAINGGKGKGWYHKGTKDLVEEIKKYGGNIPDVRVDSIKLCNANYSAPLLADERSRFVSCLMPCSISVWEGNDGKVYISKMNTGLMGMMFGGKISIVMGGKVGPDETAMLKPIIKEE